MALRLQLKLVPRTTRDYHVAQASYVSYAPPWCVLLTHGVGLMVMICMKASARRSSYRRWPSRLAGFSPAKSLKPADLAFFLRVRCGSYMTSLCDDSIYALQRIAHTITGHLSSHLFARRSVYPLVHFRLAPDSSVTDSTKIHRIVRGTCCNWRLSSK